MSELADAIALLQQLDRETLSLVRSEVDRLMREKRLDSSQVPKVGAPSNRVWS
jgi:hypothetical protein